ncbi:RES family NAD+ phosphorylase [Rhodobacteraceae bacterium M382]|nr:RES family NAD+ phosphorylase [Rhodobacteraceae bacterium M382]
MRQHAFTGVVWRILFTARNDAPLAPVLAPEGRFHHSGQPALYASLSAEGAGVAIRRYVSPCDPDRSLLGLSVQATALIDLRELPDPAVASQVWQDVRATGAPAPTWAISDWARRLGAQGMLYPSRSRSDLTHLVLFRWNAVNAAQIRLTQPPCPWRPGSDPTRDPA